MKRPVRFIACFAAFCVTFLVALRSRADEPAARGETALDRYMARPDDSFSWKIVATYPGDAYTTFVIDLKSQTWRTMADVDRTMWQHWLVVVRPNEAREL